MSCSAPWVKASIPKKRNLTFTPGQLNLGCFFLKRLTKCNLVPSGKKSCILLDTGKITLAKKSAVASFIALLDYFALGEPVRNAGDLNLHLVSRVGTGDEDNEALDPCNAVAFGSLLCYLKLILFADFDWLRCIEAAWTTRETHSFFHLTSFLLSRHIVRTPQA